MVGCLAVGYLPQQATAVSAYQLYSGLTLIWAAAQTISLCRYSLPGRAAIRLLDLWVGGRCVTCEVVGARHDWVLGRTTLWLVLVGLGRDGVRGVR